MLDERIKRSSKNRPPSSEVQLQPQKKSPDDKGKRVPQSRYFLLCDLVTFQYTLYNTFSYGVVQFTHKVYVKKFLTVPL